MKKQQTFQQLFDKYWTGFSLLNDYFKGMIISVILSIICVILNIPLTNLTIGIIVAIMLIIVYVPNLRKKK